jgi:4-amino-4-deoxy-L-arabinose transferase-like glycosyltransferase
MTAGAAGGRRRFALGLGATAVVAFSVRLVYALTHSGLGFLTDPNYYHQQANLLADGRGFVDPFTWIVQGKSAATAAHPPLFASLLSVLSWLGARSSLSHQVAGCLIGVGTVVAIGFLGRRIGGPAVGLVAAAIAAVSPNVWIYDAGLFAESLELLLVTLVLLVTYRITAPAPWRDLALLGALIGLLALTRSELLLLVPLLVLPLVIARGGPEWGRRLLGLAVAGLVCGIVIAPWLVRNETAFDEPVAMSTNGDLFVGYTNCSAAYSGSLIGWYDVRCAPRSTFADRTTDEATRMKAAREQGIRYARDHLPRLVGVVVWARAGRLWSVFEPVQTADLEATEHRPRGVSLAGVALFYLTVPFAIGGAILLARRRRGPPIWPLLVPLVVATLTAMAFAGNVRFRAVAEPSIIVFTALGAVAAWSWLRTRFRSGAAT